MGSYFTEKIIQILNPCFKRALIIPELSGKGLWKIKLPWFQGSKILVFEFRENSKNKKQSFNGNHTKIDYNATREKIYFFWSVLHSIIISTVINIYMKNEYWNNIQHSELIYILFQKIVLIAYMYWVFVFDELSSGTYFIYCMYLSLHVHMSCIYTKLWALKDKLLNSHL